MIWVTRRSKQPRKPLRCRSYQRSLQSFLGDKPSRTVLNSFSATLSIYKPI